MLFALIGSDPDGVEMACALVQSGRHRLAAYTTAATEDVLARYGPDANRVGDVEEILADAAVELGIVAGPEWLRPAQLRRAIQSERHVLCAYPPDRTPEVAYEAAMMQQDTGYVLLPLLPRGLHPGVARLRGLLGQSPEAGGVGPLVLLEVEASETGEVLLGIDEEARKLGFPGWEVLRAVGGEVEEVSAFAEADELRPGEPVLLSGRFSRGGLFQVTLLPRRKSAEWRLNAVGKGGRAELLLPQGWDGPAFLTRPDPAGGEREETWERWDPWAALVEVVEAAVERRPARALPDPDQREGIRAEPPGPGEGTGEAGLSWQDAVRGLELDDAARRSVEKRRASALEYPEATEEAGFKGTMTLVGCALVWVVLLLLILATWLPALRWVIAPALVLFLALQLLRYLIPGPRRQPPKGGGESGPAPQRPGGQ
jgi:predicted dehydrogenase